MCRRPRSLYRAALANDSYRALFLPLCGDFTNPVLGRGAFKSQPRIVYIGRTAGSRRVPKLGQTTERLSTRQRVAASMSRVVLILALAGLVFFAGCLEEGSASKSAQR